MKKILFVDDEPNILEGLQRMLFPMRKQWQMAFANGGQEALALLKREPVDVIVTDMRMPGIDGAALLAEVMKLHPQTIRFVLSGQSDKETILRSVGPAHQFLAKPCNAETLKSCIDRAFALRDLLGNKALKELLAQVNTLPSMPESYSRLCAELQSEDASVASVAQIIESDLGMTAKILQLVNSAFFGVRQHVSSVTQAVSLLGLDTTKALVLMVGVFSRGADAAPPSGYTLSFLWRHSMRTGHFAQAIAKSQGSDKMAINDALTAGILHDAGVLVLAENCGREYHEIVRHAMTTQQPLSEAEFASFGCTHAQVGAYLLGIWGLPDSIVEAVAFHHIPDACPAQTFSPLTAVHAANVLEHELGGEERDLPAPLFDAPYLTRLGLANRVTVWRDLCMDLQQSRGKDT